MVLRAATKEIYIQQGISVFPYSRGEPDTSIAVSSRGERPNQ